MYLFSPFLSFFVSFWVWQGGSFSKIGFFFLKFNSFWNATARKVNAKGPESKALTRDTHSLRVEGSHPDDSAWGSTGPIPTALFRVFFSLSHNTKISRPWFPLRWATWNVSSPPPPPNHLPQLHCHVLRMGRGFPLKRNYVIDFNMSLDEW